MEHELASEQAQADRAEEEMSEQMLHYFTHSMKRVQASLESFRKGGARIPPTDVDDLVALLREQVALWKSSAEYAEVAAGLERDRYEVAAEHIELAEALEDHSPRSRMSCLSRARSSTSGSSIPSG